MSATASATSEASRNMEQEEEEAPVLDPEYGDLLDEQLLEGGTDVLDPDDDLVDIALTIDIADEEDLDEAQSMDLDVGALLTSLPARDLDALDTGAPIDHEGAEGAMSAGALQELLLPEEGAHHEDADEVGDDERFPAFDGVSALRPSLPQAITPQISVPQPSAQQPPAPLDDDAEGPPEG